MAAGHQVRDRALPSGRAAAMVPPPARRTASRHAAPSAGWPAHRFFLLLSAVSKCRGLSWAVDGRNPPSTAHDVAGPTAAAGTGQRSPVTRDRRRASRAVAAAVSKAAVTGRRASAAAHAPAVHQDAYRGRTAPG